MSRSGVKVGKRQRKDRSLSDEVLSSLFISLFNHFYAVFAATIAAVVLRSF